MFFHSPEMIPFVAIYDIAVLVAIGLLAFACVTDFFYMTISNGVSLGILAAFAVAFGAAHLMDLPAFSEGWGHLAGLCVMFVLTFIMFMCRVWGAGDSKLSTSVALWLGLKGFMTFLLVMSFAGLGLVLLFYVFRKIQFDYAAKLGPQSWPARVNNGERVIPYGIAIGIGAIWAFFSAGYLDLCNLVQCLL